MDGSPASGVGSVSAWLGIGRLVWVAFLIT